MRPLHLLWDGFTTETLCQPTMIESPCLQHGIQRLLFWSRHFFFHKVENILKDSLDTIPSPSQLKVQIMGGKVCLMCKGKTLLGLVNKLLKTKSLMTSPSNVFPSYLKLPASNLSFHQSWRWWDWIQATFLNLFYFTYYRLPHLAKQFSSMLT